ncbi:MAG: YfiR family protein [Candidatus Riflebacteria bacterium]
MRSIQILFLALVTIFSLFSAENTRSHAAEVAEESEIKAAFIFNFLKFVHWPELKDKHTLRLLTIGKSELNTKIRLIDGREANHRQIIVCDSEKATPDQECMAMVFGEIERKEAVEYLRTCEQKPILTIGESPDFARSGGIIGLKVVKGKVRFEINLTAAEKAGLKISSQLLKLAIEVFR